MPSACERPERDSEAGSEAGAGGLQDSGALRTGGSSIIGSQAGLLSKDMWLSGGEECATV